MFIPTEASGSTSLLSIFYRFISKIYYPPVLFFLFHTHPEGKQVFPLSVFHLLPFQCRAYYICHYPITVYLTVSIEIFLCYNIFVTSINKKLAYRLRELRKKHNLTQEKLSELTNIDYRHIQRLEGKKPFDIRFSTLEKLAKAFKMSLSEFLDF